MQTFSKKWIQLEEGSSSTGSHSSLLFRNGLLLSLWGPWVTLKLTLVAWYKATQQMDDASRVWSTVHLQSGPLNLHPPECHKSAYFLYLLGESQSDTVVCHCQVFIRE